MCAALVGLSGHHVRTAYTGHDGLTVATAFRPHVLLLDIGLPDVNGYELARTIRTTAWGREAVLIAVTGWGQTEDRRRAFESGFDHHLTKPIAPEAMQSLLESVEARPA
jgi:CheY-like chemotaxis protein